MVRRLRWLVFGLLAAGLASMVLPLQKGVIEVFGDGRSAVVAAVEAVASSNAGAPPLDVVLLRRVENLRHVPETARLCRGVCDMAVTVIQEVRPGGLRKRIVVDLSQFDGAAVMDTGMPLPDGIAACIGAIAVAEAERIFPSPMVDCAPSTRRLWRLPFGL